MAINQPAKVIIISGSDAGYASLLTGLLASLEKLARADSIDIGILDLGLDGAFRMNLKRRGCLVVAPEWDYPLKLFKDRPPASFKALTARPHLRRHFPGYDLYLWIDADAWVQQWEAIRLYIDAAQRSGFAITPEVDRSYSERYATESVLSWRFRKYQKCFNNAVAESLSLLPIANSGVFAARVDAPHWAAWARTLGEIFERIREPYFFAEQIALNHVVRTGGFQRHSCLQPAIGCAIWRFLYAAKTARYSWSQIPRSTG